MSILFFFITILAAVGVLTFHSYFFRGARITFNFFFFLFLYAYRWVRKIDEFAPWRPPSKEIRILEITPLATGEPSSASLSFYLLLIITLGWIFTLYISWALAERILNRIEIFKGRIFTTILLSGLILGGICYSIETAAIGSDSLRLKFHDPMFASFLIGAPFSSIRAHFYFVIYFLAAYFLIECSKYRRVNWKCIFFLLPFISLWYFQFIHPKLSQKMAIILLPSLAILSPLKFEYGKAEWPESVKLSLTIRRLLTNIPLFMMLFMLGFVTIVDLTVIKQPALLVSVLPAVFFLLLSIKKIPFSFILILSAALFVVIGKKFVPSLIPVGFVSVLRIINNLTRRR